MGHPMRIEFTRARLLVYLANPYTTRGAPVEHEKDNYTNRDVVPVV